MSLNDMDLYHHVRTPIRVARTYTLTVLYMVMMALLLIVSQFLW